MDIESTGVWNGASAVNTGLVVNATGGTTNYAATFSGGNVGIGTTTPTAKLDVNGAINIQGVNGISYPVSDSTVGASIAIGTSALANQPASAAYHNIALGYQALGLGTLTTAATDNVAIGYKANSANTSGSENVSIGGKDVGGFNNPTLALNTTGSRNVAIGSGSMAANTIGSLNVVIGWSAGTGLTTGGQNTIIGGQSNGAGVTYATAVGSQSTVASYSVALGQGATTGSSGLAMGWVAAAGPHSLAFGAGTKTGTGSYNLAVGEGSGNTSMTGTNNTILGYQVGSATLTTGSSNILIGTSNAVTTAAAGTSNFLNVGNVIFATGMTGTVAAPAGNVGIGTTNPGAALDVKGAIRMSGATSGYTGFQPGAAAGSTVWTLPAADGSPNQVLKTDGSGTLGWVSAASGSVTSVATGTGLTGGPITTTGTISLASIAANTLLANATGAGAVPIATSISAVIDSAIGSTRGSVLYRNGATWTALTPGTAGQHLQTGGAGADPSWATPAAGTVTSVGLSLPSIFTVTNSPVTSSAVLTGTLATQAANTIFAGPSSAGPTAPTFRALVSADLPTVQVAKGGTGSTSLTPNGLLMADGAGATVSSPVCGSGMGYISNGTSFACTTIASATNTFVNGGNSFTANATLGTNDAYTLGLKTGGSTRMTIDASGNVGVGTTAPNYLFDVDGTNTSTALGVINRDSTSGRNPSVQIVDFMGAAAAGYPVLNLLNFSRYLCRSHHRDPIR
jgi:hypothetical protein